MKNRLVTLSLVAVLLAFAQRAVGEEASDDADVHALVRGNNEFALDLYKELSKETGNLCFSPLSVSTALSMLYAGARGETAVEIADTLHFALEQQRVHTAFELLHRRLPTSVLSANALWGQEGFPIRKDYLERAAKHYRAPFRYLDFTGDLLSARQEVNRWVKEATITPAPMFLTS